jgi:hypothetical protein
MRLLERPRVRAVHARASDGLSHRSRDAKIVGSHEATTRSRPMVAAVHEESDMLKIGDVVVTMSHPGPFTIVDIKGPDLVIVTAQGLKKVVRATNVRLLEKEKPASS